MSTSNHFCSVCAKQFFSVYTYTRHIDFSEQHKSKVRQLEYEEIERDEAYTFNIISTDKVETLDNNLAKDEAMQDFVMDEV